MSPEPRVPTFGEFLVARGFDPKEPRAFFRRMFVSPWAEAGFHRFWRLWNPLYGYVLFRLYVAIGGKRRPLLASLVVFLACGFFLHDVIVAASTRKISFTTTASFAAFWLFASLSRAFEGRLRQDRWPAFANILVNAACIVAGLVAGAFVSSFLR